MRFLIRELAYERPLAAGRLRYERDGQPTGAVEQWRLSAAVDNYHFLRVDLDARHAPSGRSSLYHMVLGPGGRPERLSFRAWDAAGRVNGHAIFGPGGVVVSRELGAGEPTRDEVAFDFDDDTMFWFPAAAGLTLLAGAASGTATAVWLDAADDLAPRCGEVQLTTGESEMREAAGRARPARPLTVRWADQARTVWLDEHNSPVALGRPDGLTAVATQLVRYGPD